MQQLDIAAVAADLVKSASYYLGDVVRDRLGGGRIRSAFETAMAARGKGDVIELSHGPGLADALLDTDPETGAITFNEGRHRLGRVVSAKFVEDIDEIRARPEAFMAKLDAEVARYADTVPAHATHASVPALFVAVEAYTVTWMLWGYVGTPNPGR